MHEKFDSEEEKRKKNYSQIINNLIAADDLYWNKEENKYNALSKKELDEILISCIKQGITNDQDCYAIVGWATNVKVGSLLLKNFVEGKILITNVDKDGEPFFVPNK